MGVKQFLESIAIGVIVNVLSYYVIGPPLVYAIAHWFGWAMHSCLGLWTLLVFITGVIVGVIIYAMIEEKRTIKL